MRGTVCGSGTTANYCCPWYQCVICDVPMQQLIEYEKIRMQKINMCQRVPGQCALNEPISGCTFSKKTPTGEAGLSTCSTHGTKPIRLLVRLPVRRSAEPCSGGTNAKLKGSPTALHKRPFLGPHHEFSRSQVSASGEASQCTPFLQLQCKN